MLFNGIKAAIFDFDGTLADSMEVWAEVDFKFLNKRGIKVPNNYFDDICSMNFIQAAEYTIKTFNLKESPKQIMSEWLEL
ncbi:MAG: HAD family phosphatase, partial [Clostridiales bacterium]|nr:HAD family phosphatase [Clostridiales bacterium]